MLPPLLATSSNGGYTPAQVQGIGPTAIRVAMVDAYVDASLSHFDISPSLSMDVAPAVIRDTRSSRPAFGLTWAFNF